MRERLPALHRLTRVTQVVEGIINEITCSGFIQESEVMMNNLVFNVPQMSANNREQKLEL